MRDRSRRGLLTLLVVTAVFCLLLSVLAGQTGTAPAAAQQSPSETIIAVVPLEQPDGSSAFLAFTMEGTVYRSDPTGRRWERWGEVLPANR
jgi:hypothetical protein